MLFLVAIKGLPGVGKTTIAHALARRLRWPVLCKDDIRDHLIILDKKVNQQVQGINLDSNDYCYDILHHLAATQLQCGLSVIVESPLSHAHLYSDLTSIAARLKESCRLVVVECTLPSNVEWEERLATRASDSKIEKHQPSSLRDIELVLKKYNGSHEYPIAHPKLVLNMSHTIDKLLDQTINWLYSLGLDKLQYSRL